jgi:hypothetical protein
MTPTDLPPFLLLFRPVAGFGRWWWRRWSRPRNPYLAGTSAVFWLAVLAFGLWFRGWMLATARPDVIVHRDEVLPLLTWFLLVAVSWLYLSLAFVVRARTVELVGWRRQTFLMLTVASHTVTLAAFVYFGAAVD